MDKNINATKDFEFVLRVLNSSENREHIKISDNLFENFKNKWTNKIDCTQMVEYMFSFHNNYIKKINKL